MNKLSEAIKNVISRYVINPKLDIKDWVFCPSACPELLAIELKCMLIDEFNFIETTELEATIEPDRKRFDAACSTLSGMLANPYKNRISMTDRLVKKAYQYADELIEQEDYK